MRTIPKGLHNVSSMTINEVIADIITQIRDADITTPKKKRPARVKIEFTTLNEWANSLTQVAQDLQGVAGVLEEMNEVVESGILGAAVEDITAIVGEQDVITIMAETSDDTSTYCEQCNDYHNAPFNPASTDLNDAKEELLRAMREATPTPDMKSTHERSLNIGKNPTIETFTDEDERRYSEAVVAAKEAFMNTVSDIPIGKDMVIGVEIGVQLLRAVPREQA